MRRLILAALFALAGCASTGGGDGDPAPEPDEPLPELTLAEARTTFVDLAQAADVSWQYAFAKIRGVNLSRDGATVSFGLTYADDKEKAYRPAECRMDFKALQSVRIESVGAVVGAGKRRRWVKLDPQPCDLMWFFDEGEPQKARRFAASVSRLATATTEEVAADRKLADDSFEAAVREHEKDPRREISDRMKQIILAGRKAREAGDLEKTIRSYNRVLEECPWWPEGYRDRATILGELGRFDSAAADRKRYLRLEPRARDAKHARERIAAWEGKGR